MTITLNQRYFISPSDVELIAIDYQDILSSTEQITGTPTVTEITTTNLTFANIAVNTTTTVIFGREVAIGKAVGFKVSGQLLNTDYRARVQVVTTSNPARTLNRDILFDCR